MALRAATLLSLAALVCACSRGKVTRAECDEMLDRYVAMKIDGDPTLAKLPPAQASIARDMKREVAKGSKSYRQVEDQCEHEVTRAEYSCAMKAPGPNDWEACIE